jgi:hypothetical protein
MWIKLLIFSKFLVSPLPHPIDLSPFFLMCPIPQSILTFFTRLVGKVNMKLQLDATITVLLISKISSTCFGQTFDHLQERKT